MPKIKTVAMQTPEASSPEDYKRQMLLAQGLMQADGPDKVYSPAVGLASAASKAFGGWMAGQIQRDEKNADESAWNPVKALVDQSIKGMGGSSSGSSSGSSTANPADLPAPNASEAQGSAYISGDEHRSAANTGASWDRAKQAVGILTGLGWTPEAATGAVGNLMHESGLEPVRAVGDNGTAHGLAQWRGERLANLQRFAQSLGKDPGDFETQVRFIDHEAKNGLDAGAGQFYKAMPNYKSYTDAAAAFMNLYERPSISAARTSGPMRQEYARRLMEMGMPPAQAQAQANQADLPAPDAQEQQFMVPGQNGGPPTVVPVQTAQGPQPAPQQAPQQPRPAPQPMPQVNIPQPDFRAAQQQLVISQQMMANPRTRAAGFQLYQQAMSDIQAQKQAYLNAQKELAIKQQEWALKNRELGQGDERLGVDRERLGVDKADKEGRLALDRRKQDFDEKKPFTAGRDQRVITYGPDGQPRVSIDADPNVPTEIQELRYLQSNPDLKKTDLERRSASRTQVNVGGGSDKQIFDAMKDSADAANSALTGLNGIRQARTALKGGGYFGSFADERLAWGKLGALFGGDPEKVINTETFRSTIAPQISALIKQTVGSTGISNADREFAEKAAGGSIKLDEGTLNRLMTIMSKASRIVIEKHIKKLDAVYPDGDSFKRERALFGVDMPEDMPDDQPATDIQSLYQKYGIKP